jgi:GntR family transcriptional regulator / MocR family aminotransferase
VQGRAIGIEKLSHKSGDLALAERLFETLRDRILDGIMRHGEKLPGTRIIARDAGVSRWTAVLAVDMLIAEGLAQARKRSGTYVSWAGSPAEHRPGPASADHAESLSPHQPFAVGVPGLDLFPMQVWRRLQARRWKQMPLDALQTGHDGGWPDLRAAVAAHVALARGIKCAPSQVFITTSAHAAVLIAGEVLARPGSVVWTEDPGYFRTHAALRAAGLAPVSVRVDGEGIDIDEGRRQAPKAAMAIVTPSVQFPTGTQMTEARKRALLAWSNEVGSFIIEDDFCGEFVSARPPIALAAMPDAARVVYMNTFSATIFPSLRLSYLIVPKPLCERFNESVRQTERYATVPNQIVLADFLTSGQFAKHLRRCRDAYAERRQVLIDALRDECAGLLIAGGGEGGIHLCLRFAKPMNDIAVAAAARDAGLIVEPLSQFYVNAPKQSGLLLGYAGFRPELLRDSAKRLGKVLKSTAARLSA